MRHSSPSVRLLLFLWAASLLVLLPGCDGFGSKGGSFDVPPERLVAMVAVYENTRRLVVADFENPAHYRVLRKAGRKVDMPCFSPDKRRLLFADQEGGIVGSRAPLKLYDLDAGEVRTLEGAPVAATHGGTNVRCVWSADGNGFYYQAAGPAGVTYPTYYSIESNEARPFGPLGIRFHGRKGRDTLLVKMGNLHLGDEDLSSFCFVSAQTGNVFECARNKYLKFVRWEDEERGGWKQAAYAVTYDDASDKIAFTRSVDGERSLALTDLDGSFLTTLASGATLYTDLTWGPGGTVLFNKRDSGDPPPRIHVADVKTGEVRTLVDPSVIGGARQLIDPDF